MTNECSWDGPSMAPYSMTEPYECHEPGTVYHLGAGVSFCTRHFLKFDKEFGDQFPFRFSPTPSQYTGTVIAELIDLVDEVERRVSL